MENNCMEVSQKIKSTIRWSSHSTSGYTLPKHLKQGVVEIFVHSYAIPALFSIAKRWMQSKCPSMNKWIYKTWHRHANGRIFSLEKTFWHMPQPGWNLWANIQPYLQTCLIFKLQNDLGFFFNWRKICLNRKKYCWVPQIKDKMDKMRTRSTYSLYYPSVGLVPCW